MPRSVLLLLAALLPLATSCERISPEVSIPGYGEKKASEEKTESKPLGSSENPPAFFSGQGNE